MRMLTGFAPLAARYEGFILDLWGVIHDGVAPYPGAVEVLARLRAAGKPAVLLSNAPRRAAAAQASMREMGIPDDLYTGILTSGEATHRMLRDRSDPFFAALGRRVYHLGPERDRSVLDGLDLDRVALPAQADFVLNTGPDDARDPTDATLYDEELRACLAAGLPMVCANPDLEVVRGDKLVICAGLLTLRYEALGGMTRWVGKPDAAVYATVLAMLGVERARVLAVGDALRTDIAGAAGVGIDACWVLGGIHAGELHGDAGTAAEAARRAGLDPVAAVWSFAW
jgi:HAD superfamily hydrolase (TIGR01459 family)